MLFSSIHLHMLQFTPTGAKYKNPHKSTVDIILDPMKFTTNRYSTIGIMTATKSIPKEFPRNLTHWSMSKGLLINRIFILFFANNSIKPSKESQMIQGYFFIISPFG